MLDPLTALSLAGTIVQFIEFSFTLVAKGTELYNSTDGASLGNADLEIIAKDLQDLNGRLQHSPPSENANKTTLTDRDVALRKLSEQCSGVARELIDALDKSKVQGTSNRRWKSFRQALKGLMKKDEVDAIAQRLQHFRDELNLHILVSMRDTLDMQAIKQTEGFRNLDQVTRELVHRLEQDQTQLRQDLKGHTEHLSRGQGHTNEIITREHERTRRTILASIQSGRASQLSQKRQGFTESNEDLDQVEKDFLIESLLLTSLRFPTMENRFEEVEPAHRKTFEWIFRPPAQQTKWSDFPLWLSEGTGIYWINGKAASGKSTLMRFICENPRTATLLDKWSRPKQLIRAMHFFWNSGTADQRSYEGLLRALLFNIFEQARHLIRVVFPDKWAARRGYPIKLVQDPESWTLPRLIKAFDHLFQQASDDLTFCLFVDGLDEYDGDPFDIIDLFTRISKLANVKLCLSSRPLFDFVRSFRSFPTLRLQDLNFRDIKQYVDDELGANDQMQELHRKEREQAPKLSLEIIDKADGVFLWVRLVVHSLLRGLRNSDHISDLQRRLRLLPPSLEDLFSHILGRLEPVYLQQSSRIFRIFAASRLTNHTLTSLELSFAEEPDSQSLLLSGAGLISETEKASRIELVEIWLVTRCGGLIETHKSLNPTLSYLHRTVRDFLELPQVWSRILGPTHDSDFNPYVSLLQSSVLYIKLALMPKGYATDSDRETLLDVAAKTLKYAHQAELETNKAEILLLDVLDGVMEDAAPSIPLFRTRVEDQILVENLEFPDDFLSLAIRNGLYHYVAQKIECGPDIVRKKAGRPLLEYAVLDGINSDFAELRLSSKIVELLMQNGSSPNQIYKEDSAWNSVLRRLRNHPRSRRDRQRSRIGKDNDSFELLKIIQIFIENGAVVNEDIYEKISRSFMAPFPEETKKLQSIMLAKEALKEENRSKMVNIPLGRSRDN